MVEDAAKKYVMWGDRLAVVLKRHLLVVHRLSGKTKEQEWAGPKISEKVGKVFG